MDTQGYTGRSDQGAVPAAARTSATAGGRLALMSLLVGATVGAGLGWSVTSTSTPTAAADLPVTAVASPVIKPSDSSVAGDTASGRQALVVAIPEEHAYLKSSSIAIAGRSFGRPHGPLIRSVQVELYVAGQLVQRADLEVFSSRFAGVLKLSTPIDRADAELRISDPARTASPIVVRHVTIDAR